MFRTGANAGQRTTLVVFHHRIFSIQFQFGCVWKCAFRGVMNFLLTGRFRASFNFPAHRAARICFAASTVVGHAAATVATWNSRWKNEGATPEPLVPIFPVSSRIPRLWLAGLTARLTSSESAHASWLLLAQRTSCGTRMDIHPYLYRVWQADQQGSKPADGRTTGRTGGQAGRQAGGQECRLLAGKKAVVELARRPI